jgi:xylulokinase
VSSRAYPTRHGAEGWAEQDPTDWLRAFAAALHELSEVAQLRDVRALAFTGQMSAALPVDASGHALHPALIWSDQRATAETEAAARRITPEAFYALTGNTLNATYTGPKLAWLARHRPEVWAAAKTFLQPKDWLIAQLTGVLAMDHSDASCTGLYELATGTWNSRLFDLFGLPLAMAPPLAEAASVIGTLEASMARRLGLPAGLPIVLGGGDGPTSALGTGIGRGEGYLSIGTSAWVSFLHDAPVVDAARRVFSFRHVLPGLYAVTGSTQNAGSAFAWLGSLLEASDLAAEVRTALATITPGAEGIMVLPYLQGERTPVWDSHATGAVLGLRSHHGRLHLIRAFAEAVCFQIGLILETLADCGLASRQLRVVGGLSSEPMVLRLLASVVQHRLRRPPGYLQTTSMGAAMLAALALGASASEVRALASLDDGEDFEPDIVPDALVVNYHAYRSLYPALKDLQSKLLSGSRDR